MSNTVATPATNNTTGGATATHPTVPTEQAAALLVKLADLIATEADQRTRWEDAKAKNDKPTKSSLEGHLAISSMRIREVEFELACEGHEVTPWQPNKKGRTSTTGITQEQLQANLDKVWAMTKDTTFASVKKNRDARMQALLEAAVKNGFEVVDPRNLED